MLYEKFNKIVKDNNLLSNKVKCIILSGERLKLPSGEYLVARGEEVILQAQVDLGYGHAFTSSPRGFEGKVSDVLEFVYGKNWERAIFFATLNAVLHKLNMIKGTIHCREGEPEICGEDLAKEILKFGSAKVAHIGYQPGHVKALAKSLGPENLFVTDLDPLNVGKVKFGVEILDGARNSEVLRKADIAYITGSAAANGTLAGLLETCSTCGIKPVIYGVTGKGACKLLGLEVFCPYGHDSL
ncbi:MAG: Rossmann-like domain-containing protein [Thermoproteota archaeon]